MEQISSIFKKKFISSLSKENKQIMEKVHVGTLVEVECSCESLVIGKIKYFDEDAVVIQLSDESSVLVGSRSVSKIRLG